MNQKTRQDLHNQQDFAEARTQLVGAHYILVAKLSWKAGK